MTDRSAARERVRPTEKARRARMIALCLVLAILVPGIWFICRCAEQNQTSTLETFAMGSYVRQTLWGGSDEDAQAANQAIAELENQISWRRQGDIAALNQAEGQPVSLGEDAARVLGETLLISEKSGGALDPTLGPVTRLWNFDSDPHLPDSDELSAALALVDYRALALTEAGEASLSRPGMQVDLGAVGKGAACDKALACYQRDGVRAAVVAVGGSVGLWGKKPDGTPWRVSVRDPGGAGSLGVLELDGGFVSTSGSYEKFFEAEGRTYCHLLDPATGYPAESGLVSVTVWCPDSGALSDGLATACFVLGMEEGVKLVEDFGGGGVFVDETGNVTVAGALKGRYTAS